MPNLRGASPVGRVGGGRSYAARAEGSRWLPQRRLRGRSRSAKRSQWVELAGRRHKMTRGGACG